MNNYDMEILALTDGHFGNVDLSTEPAITLNGLTREFTFANNFNKVIALVGDINSNIVLFKCDRIIEGHDISQCSNRTLWWKKGASSPASTQLKILQADTEFVYFTWEVPSSLTTEAAKITCVVKFSDYDSNGNTRWSWRSLQLDGLEIAKDDFALPAETPMPDKFLWGDVCNGQVTLINKGESVKLEPGYVYIVNGVSLSQVGFLYSSQWSEYPQQYMYDFFAPSLCFGWEKQIGSCYGVNYSTSFYIKDGTTIFCPAGTATSGSPYRITFMQASESRQTGAYVDYYADPNNPMSGVYFVPYSGNSPGVVFKFKINEAFYQV